MNPANNLLMFKKELWIKDYSLRIQRWLSGEALPPVRIDAELHRRCNLKCLHCIRRCSKSDMTEESKKIEVEEERWLDVVKESGKMGVKSWNIAGIGEPMIKPSLVLNMIKLIKQYNMFGELTTNGTLWEEEHVKQVVDTGWDSINISLDGKDPHTHDTIRQTEGAFKKATQTIRLFNEYRTKLNKKTPCITMNLVLNKLNYSQLPEMIRLAKDFGADAIFVEPMIVYGELGERLRMNKDQIKQMPSIINETEELAKKLEVLTFISCMEGEDEEQKFNKDLVKKTGDIREVIISNSEDSVKKKIFNFSKWSEYPSSIEEILKIPCYHPWFYLMISTDGSVAHCGECRNLDENIKNKSLEKIWLGEQLKRTRNAFLEKKLPDYCSKCRPNVIGDIRIVRKSIKEYADIMMIQNTLVNIMKENMILSNGKPLIKKRKTRKELLKELIKGGSEIWMEE